ncbi:MAG: TolC family protein, partial [Candidatus Omnitrophica bacterium]|nr:TolC family protein [Candidatus Omnitrophota bacterium]
MEKTGVFFIIFIFLFSNILMAQEPIILSLDEAVQIALRNNRDILLGQEDVKKAKEKISESRAAFFPSLNFSGTWSDTRGLYPKDLISATTQTTLKQYLYRGGKTINTIRFNGYNLEAAEAILDRTKSDVLINLIKAFYTALLSTELAELDKAILENTQEHLESLRIRYNNGQASETDILKLEATLGNLRQAYEQSLSQAESSNALLKNLLYLKEETEVEPKGEFSFELQELAYDEAFLKAMKMRPEIRHYEALKEASKKAVEIAKADAKPTIYASWDYYSRSTTSLTFMPNKGWQDYNIIGITFSWPVFDGWKTKAKVQQAITDLKQAELLKEKLVKD